MVTVTQSAPVSGGNRVEDFLQAASVERSAAELSVIREACTTAEQAHTGQARASGEPFLHHALAVAQILIDLRLDHETVAAAILHDVVEDTSVGLDDIRAKFGDRIATLVDGVTKMSVLPEYRDATGETRQDHVRAESLRKMLLAMAEDVRVVLIKLADRLHNMRTLAALPGDKQQRIARETMDIFAPLANRLGIWQLKWELEDLSFRYLEPGPYKQIAEWLAEKRIDREEYIGRFVQTLVGEIEKAGIEADVSGRPKHIWGIWRKMKRKRKDFAQISDIRGVRVLVDSVRDCYAVLGIVHSLWSYIPGEFDDYIATPKENGYRSIHTAVIGPEGRTVEVQIRTRQMHQQSEYGIAAHWRYKEGAKTDDTFDRKIRWLRTLLEWKDEVAEAADFVDQFKSEIFTERVYVFTPKGKIVDLPVGATPLDFAYHIHTDVGHRCRGARVDGRMVPLTYALKTGEQVEIITVKEGGPSRDWLSPHLGYLATSKARAKVQHWFREQNLDASIAAGRAQLEREFARLGIADVNFEALTQHFRLAKVEDFLAAIGHGEIKPAQIASAIERIYGLQLRSAPPQPAPSVPVRVAPVEGSVAIQGVGNLLTRIAKCCNPLPGDAIMGFITRGGGVTIHRRDCPNAMHHRDEQEERVIEVSWGEMARTYPVDIEITAYERSGLLRDITGLLANEKINVIAVNTLTDKNAHVARMRLTIEIPDLDALSRVLSAIDQIPNVSDVRRRVH